MSNSALTVSGNVDDFEIFNLIAIYSIDEQSLYGKPVELKTNKFNLKSQSNDDFGFLKSRLTKKHQNYSLKSDPYEPKDDQGLAPFSYTKVSFPIMVFELILIVKP
jgi:hypothetical protein